MMTGGQVAFDCLKSNNQDPNDWFNAFEKYAASWNWDHNIMARKVPVYFKGEADYHWSQLSSEERADYDFVKYYMIRKLTPKNNIQASSQHHQSKSAHRQMDRRAVTNVAVPMILEEIAQISKQNVEARVNKCHARTMNT
jgi:hypothetical protein